MRRRPIMLILKITRSKQRLETETFGRDLCMSRDYKLLKLVNFNCIMCMPMLCIGTLLSVCIHVVIRVLISQVSDAACGISYNSSLILVVCGPFWNLKFELSLCADNNPFPLRNFIRKYQLFVPEVEINANQLFRHMRDIHVFKCYFKVLNCSLFRNRHKFCQCSQTFNLILRISYSYRFFASV